MFEYDDQAHRLGIDHIQTRCDCLNIEAIINESGKRISGNTDGMPCVEIKDLNLLESGVMVIGLGDCGIFPPVATHGPFC